MWYESGVIAVRPKPGEKKTSEAKAPLDIYKELYYMVLG
jgi:hypothetical protein